MPLRPSKTPTNGLLVGFSSNVQHSTIGISISNTLTAQTEGLACKGAKGSYQCSTSEESGLAACQNPVILQPLQDEGQMVEKKINSSTNPKFTTVQSTLPEVSNAGNFRTPKEIGKSNSGEVTSNKIDSILLKLDRSGLSSAATEKTDLFQRASGNCRSSYSSSPCVSAIASVSTLIDKVPSQNNVTVEKDQLLELVYHNSFKGEANETNITEDKNIMNLAYQTAFQDAMGKSNTAKEKVQAPEVYQTVFENATKSSNLTKHDVASDEYEEKAGSPLLDVNIGFPAVLEVKKSYLSAIEGSSLKEKHNCNSNVAEDNIMELSQSMEISADSNLAAHEISPSLDICICNASPYGYMVKCIACGQQFHAACVTLENKVSDEELVYTCQNCKTGLTKKRKKLRCLTSKLTSERDAS